MKAIFREEYILILFAKMTILYYEGRDSIRHH